MSFISCSSGRSKKSYIPKPRLGRSIKIEEIEDRSGSADPIRSTSKIEADRSLPDFIIDLYRSLLIISIFFDFYRSCSVIVFWQMFGCFALLKLYHITAQIFSYCCKLNKCPKFFPSKVAKVALLLAISYKFIT